MCRLPLTTKEGLSPFRVDGPALDQTVLCGQTCGYTENAIAYLRAGSSYLQMEVCQCRTAAMVCTLTSGSGYSLSRFVLIPFARNELRVDGRRRRDFNYKISRARIVVEWVFGRLKARFPALKRLGAVRDMKNIYRAIEAMMIVHNMCHELGDAPTGLRVQLDADDDLAEADRDDQESDNDEHHNVDQEDMDSLCQGRAFRERCVALLCPL
jgi:hypothetical protein